MKSIITSIISVVLSWTLISSGCGDSGGGVSTFNAPNGTGPKGGSSARFTIAKDRLFIVAKQDLKIYNISNPTKMLATNTVNIGNDIETIYPYKNNLYIAGSGGMDQYNITNPDKPSNKVFVQHVTGCDPVVANDSMAWLTILGGTNCRGSINEMQVFSLNASLNSMQLLYKINMSSPRGLGLHGNYVYVCDFSNGIHVFPCSKINTGNSDIYKLPNTNFLDLIPYNTYLICQTNRGIVYLDVADPKQPKFISEITD
jgi:hypothetical protein